MVLYTRDSPFIAGVRNIPKKMLPGDFDKLAEKTGYPQQELLKYHKFFSNLAIGKGVDCQGLSTFLGRFGNVDPTDEFVCRRLFEVVNTRGHPTVSFEQVIGLLQIIKPPGLNPFDTEGMMNDTSAMCTKVHLFFDIVDTNQSGNLCMREIQDMTMTKNCDKLDVAKERRKMMLDKVMMQVYEELGKARTDNISREELLHAVGSIPEVKRFFSKNLYLAANVQ